MEKEKLLVMENIPGKNDFLIFLMKVFPPFALVVMSKLASDYREGKRNSFLSTTVITALAAVGAIIGYWITEWVHWREYKQALTIFFFGLFADKLIEFLFSKYFIKVMLNVIQDSMVSAMKSLISRIKTKD